MTVNGKFLNSLATCLVPQVSSPVPGLRLVSDEGGCWWTSEVQWYVAVVSVVCGRIHYSCDKREIRAPHDVSSGRPLQQLLTEGDEAVPRKIRS